MIESLIMLGFNLHQSKILSILLDEQWHTMRELETTCELRQPEVSVALKALADYLEVESSRVEKGRPIKLVRIDDLNLMRSDINTRISEEYNEKFSALECLGDLTPLHEEDN